MKRWSASVLLALGLATSPAVAGTVGVGAFGGVNVPVVQDDNGRGSTFGLRVPVALHRFVTVEPYFGTTNDGDATQTIGGTDYTRSGFGIRSFGANLLLTFGSRLQFYPFAGLGSSRLTRTGSADQTATRFGAGLGLGICPAPKFMIHLRGQGERLTHGDSGRIFADVTAGVSYTIQTFAAK